MLPPSPRWNEWRSWAELSWVELLCNWKCQSVSQSILASNPSMTLDQTSAEVRQLLGWCSGVSSLTGGRVCLLYSILYWSLLYLTLWSLLTRLSTGVFFPRPSTGVFQTESESESQLTISQSVSQSLCRSLSPSLLSSSKWMALGKVA